MTLHPTVLADLLDIEVEQARSALGDRAGDLHREGPFLRMTITRPDGTWMLQFDGTHFDSEPYDVALVDGNGTVLPFDCWIPGLAHSVHPVLGVPWVCISGTRAFYAYPGHHLDRWATGRYSLRADTSIRRILDRVGA
jgi:hypothetical protein